MCSHAFIAPQRPLIGALSLSNIMETNWTGFELILYFEGTHLYNVMVVACSFATFDSSYYAPAYYLPSHLCLTLQMGMRELHNTCDMPLFISSRDTGPSRSSLSLPPPPPPTETLFPTPRLAPPPPLLPFPSSNSCWACWSTASFCIKSTASL